MTKRTIVIVLIIFLVLILGIYRAFFWKAKPSFSVVKVTKENISQEVSATGVVKQGEEIDLAFKNSGGVEKILVKVGDSVKSGDTLAKLDTSQLFIQLKNTEAVLEVAQANLNKLLAGASQEEIDAAKTTVNNAEISLATAQNNLSDAYQNASNNLDDSYLKINNSYNTADLVSRTYFSTNDQDSIKAKENRGLIKEAMDNAKSYIDIAKNDPKNENVDIALSKVKDSLDIIANSLGVIREICENPFYRSIVSSTDKTSLDTRRVDINTTRTNVITFQQTISSKQFSLDSANGLLQAAKDQLALTTAKPRQEDIDLHEAQVEQAKSEKDLLQAQLGDAMLKSPTDGKVTQVNKNEGEIAIAAESVISLLSDSPYQIKVDIYEEDVVKMIIGNAVYINLTAFPQEVFKGKIVSIGPDQTLKEGVVYYETTIDFENPPEKVKPGMTADLTIITVTKDNVLAVPNAAIEIVDDKATVQILSGKNINTRQIEIGIKSSNDMVEVISGLKEGEEVVIKK